ncbi:hypothetical protein [Streptomyces sp. GbtcB7]|uniref:hypothetical protein n=1 Tax=Streptomyces sp. GbtcB7 TaxID=2824752 RepID=UPI001C2F98A3|nr:hypothetical protein [Streptomyces sp. GbtcB7]
MKPGELLAVVGEDLGRHPVGPHRAHESVCDGLAGRHCQDGGGDDEPGVIVDPGEHLALAAVGQEDPADQVHQPLRRQAHLRPTLTRRTATPHRNGPLNELA